MTIKRGNAQSGAIFSECEKYRYALWRQWDVLAKKPQFMAFIGLNPSTADEHENDPTVRRCISFAKREGFQGMYMLNLFAYRATDPRVMLAADDPIGGIENDRIIGDTIENAAKAVACWGCEGAYRHRDKAVARLRRIWGAKAELLGDILWSFGTTKEGHPRHPLYLPGDAPLTRFVVKGYR